MCEHKEQLHYPYRGFIWVVAACLGWCGLYVVVVATGGLVRLALHALGL